MFKERLISGVIVLAIAVAAILLGGYVLFFFTAAISLIGLFEYYRAIGIEKNPTAIAGYCGWAVLYLLLFLGINGAPMMGMAAGTIFIMSSIAAPAIPPTKPSTLFFGLRIGNILCFPNFTPTQ